MTPPSTPHVVRRHADVCRILADPDYAVPTAEQSTESGTLAWLRATVSRFSNGPDHDRRRAQVEAVLSQISPAGLRASAYERARAELGGAAPEWSVAVLRDVPVAVLASALGALGPEPALLGAVKAVSAGYLRRPTDEERRAADAGVECLLDQFGGDVSERSANVIALLIQMAAPTGTVIARAIEHAAQIGMGRWSVESLISETLRYDSPAQSTRRMKPAGEEMLLDLAAANRDGSVFSEPDRFEPGRPFEASLAFGHGPRACPGAEHALALASGVVAAAVVRPWTLGSTASCRPRGG